MLNLSLNNCSTAPGISACNFRNSAATLLLTFREKEGRGGGGEKGREGRGEEKGRG